MLNKQIASIFLLLALAGHVYADTCPDSAEIKVGYDGIFFAKDSSGRIWKGENPGIQTIDNTAFVFESATYITEDEDETGPINVSQLSCRYKKIALVLDNVTGWKSSSMAWDTSNNCTESISECSFTITNK
ncbi:Protein of unknown function (DUF3757) [Pseudomonas sp. GM21]|uniref:DUF3757 domain-containing protein n=1 Tax=Pseudomonas sp. GM21 TaxID=1144325 RepID=UPI0002722975|nr:DUF3757 domain-containing protein [Pseudomonas sp. GM21]EJM14281.1 Protein of unknown function (DUF3757) [Pseudomonas sp. GM21]